MAQSATIFKADLQIADMDRHYYADHSVVLARHPSETDERMMVRLAAFVLHASDQLEFTRGLCADDEPELWIKGLTGEIETWIDVGLPDLRHIRRASNRAKQVFVYAYGGHAAQLWWEKIALELARFDNVQVMELTRQSTRELEALVSRTMRLQCSLQDGQLWMSDGENTVLVEPVGLYSGNRK
jgi:uncharacterized protein YaeQ